MTFFYSFTQTILHSLWQALLLAALYFVVELFSKKTHPLQKRNFLYFLLITQLCISIFTFLVYLNGFNIAGAVALTNFDKVRSLVFLRNYNAYIFSVYSIVVLIKITSLFLQWFNFTRSFKNQLQRPSATIKIFTEIKTYQLGIKRKVEVWFSCNIKTPLTFGFLKPIILLPVALVNNTSVEEIESIILHELTHIKSKDYLLNWLLLSIEIIYFFNPFIKFLTQNLKQEREKNCDVQVINFEYNPLQYAQTLLGLAKNKVGLKNFQVGFVKKRSQLFQRIRFFSDEKNLAFTNVHSLAYLLLLLPLICFICCLITGPNVKKINKIGPVASVQINDFIQNTSLATSVVVQNTSAFNNEKLLYKSEKNKKYRKNVVGKIIQENVNKTAATNDLYMPVSLNETPDSTKEIIYKLETQTGKITQSYKLIQIRGNWVFQPQWMIVETKPNAHPVLDSAYLFNVSDSIQ